MLVEWESLEVQICVSARADDAADLLDVGLQQTDEPNGGPFPKVAGAPEWDE